MARVPPALEVLLRFARLGMTSFGGPIAHLGYFRREFVECARWLDDATYSEIVALCMVLPGPTSSQVGILLGARRAGPLGAILAWLAFTTPSAVLLACFGWLLAAGNEIGRSDDGRLTNWVAQLEATHATLMTVVSAALVALAYVALAVVFLAVIALAHSVVVTAFARGFAFVALAIALPLAFYAPGYTWITLVAGAGFGAWLGPRRTTVPSPIALSVARPLGIAAIIVLIAALVTVPFFAHDAYAELFAATFRAGSLVFGGGHVVLSYLGSLENHRAVASGTFDAGYGLAQAVPGPLFTFAAFLGASDHEIERPGLGALVATIGIFLPSFLILPAALALWNPLRAHPSAGAVLSGLNVAVVGMLAAAFFKLAATIVPRAYTRPIDLLIVVLAFALLARVRWPAWSVVLACATSAALWEAIVLGLRLPSRFGLV